MTNPLTHTQMADLPADRQAVKALASLEGISVETVRKIYTGANNERK